MMTFPSFYAADRRRKRSRERDIGLYWRDGAHGPTSARRGCTTPAS
jgi:hypothetical protein